MRLNVLMKVEIPKDEVLYTLVKSIEDFEQMINTSGIPNIVAEKDENLELIVEGLSKQNRMLDSIDRGINVLFDIHKQLLDKESAEHKHAVDQDQRVIDVSPSDDISPQAGQIEKIHDQQTKQAELDAKSHYIYITTKVTLTDDEKQHIDVTDNIEAFELPLIDKAKFQSLSLYLMRTLGRTKDEADQEVTRALTTIEQKTRYQDPPVVALEAMNESIAKAIADISS